MAYNPPAVLVTLHGYSRHDPTKGNAAVTNTLSFPPSTDYFFGVREIGVARKASRASDGVQRSRYTSQLQIGGLVAPFFGIGIVLFLVFLVAYIAACCSRCFECCRCSACCKPSKRRGDEEQRSKAIAVMHFLGSLRFLFPAAVFFVFFLSAGFISWTPAMAQGFSYSLNEVNNMADLLTATNTSLGQGLLPAAIALNRTAQDLRATMISDGVVYDVIDKLNSMCDKSNTFITLINSVTSLLTPLISSLRSASTMEVASGYALKDLGGDIRLYLSGLAGLLMFIVAIAALLACVKTRHAAFAFRCLCLCPLLVSLLVAWLATGLLLFLSTVGADVCYDPTTTILNIANSTLKGGEMYDTLAYYITPCGTTAPRGAFKSIQDQLLQQVTYTHDQLVSMNVTLRNTSGVSDQARLDALLPSGDITFEVARIADAVNASVATIDCPTFYNGLWLPVSCAAGVQLQAAEAPSSQLKISTAICVFLTLAALFAAFLGCKHPGDDPGIFGSDIAPEQQDGGFSKGSTHMVVSMPQQPPPYATPYNQAGYHPYPVSAAPTPAPVAPAFATASPTDLKYPPPSPQAVSHPDAGPPQARPPVHLAPSPSVQALAAARDESADPTAGGATARHQLPAEERPAEAGAP